MHIARAAPASPPAAGRGSAKSQCFEPASVIFFLCCLDCFSCRRSHPHRATTRPPPLLQLQLVVRLPSRRTAAASPRQDGPHPKAPLQSRTRSLPTRLVIPATHWHRLQLYRAAQCARSRCVARFGRKHGNAWGADWFLRPPFIGWAAATSSSKDGNH